MADLMTALRNAHAAGDENAARRITAMIKAQRQQKPMAEEAPAPELSGSDVSRGRASSLLEGATFGWGDEAAAALAATMAKISGDEKDWGDIYEDIQQAESERQDIYTEQRPGEALGFSLAGGLGTGGVGASKALGKMAQKGATTLQKALAGTGIGAVEGGIAGAGAADPGERLEGAQQGAVLGTILPAALGAGRGVAGQVAKRRVAEDLVDEAGDFVPLNLATDEGSFLQNLYQKIIGPSFGGQTLRDQNRRILEKAVAKTEAAEGALDLAKTTGKKTLNKALRQEALKSSLPAGASDEVRNMVQKAEGHESIKALSEAWEDGFQVVKDKTFRLNPDELVEEAIADLDSPVDADFIDDIKKVVNKRIGQGFKADTAPPPTRYRTKGMGAEKVPDVKLDVGDVDGNYLMQARDDLKMAANQLGDEGRDALKKSAYRNAANKIDDQIRDQLGAGDAAKFDDELAAWANFDTARTASRKAVAKNQGDWTTEDWLQSVRQKSGRAAEKGQATLQEQAQNLQRQGEEAIEGLTKSKEAARQAESQIRKVIPELNPTPWQKGVATVTLGGIPSMLTGNVISGMPIGMGFGKLLSTEGAQKALAGQTGMQQALAERLRTLDASDLQRFIQALQGAGTRAFIMED